MVVIRLYLPYLSIISTHYRGMRMRFENMLYDIGDPRATEVFGIIIMLYDDKVSTLPYLTFQRAENQNITQFQDQGGSQVTAFFFSLPACSLSSFSSLSLSLSLWQCVDISVRIV